MMKGGLYIKKGYTSDTAFRHFIENSNISYLSKGSYGIILKCKLNDGIESPYTNLRTIYKDKEVRNIIIKFSLLYIFNESYEMEFTSEPLAPSSQQLLDKQQEERQLQVQEEQKIKDERELIDEQRIQLRLTQNKRERDLDDLFDDEKITREEYNKRLLILKDENKKEEDEANKKYIQLYNDLTDRLSRIRLAHVKPVEKITSVTVKEFNDEVKMQTEIFNKTKDNLDPICPSIIYNNYLNLFNKESSTEMNALLKILNDKVNHDGVKKLFAKLDKTTLFGLIGMELMDDYVTLNNTNGPRYKNMARLRLIELAVKTGYSHNDFHGGNILVNRTALGYYGDGREGHVLLIDFGYTQKIPEDLLKKIRTLYDENKFNEILDMFHNERRLFVDIFDYNKHPQYKWILMDNTIEAQNIKVTNDYIKLLKDEYKKYEELVDENKKKTELPIIKDEEHKEDQTRKRKAEGGKKKNNKSIRKNNMRKRKTNKRRQSKRK